MYNLDNTASYGEIYTADCSRCKSLYFPHITRRQSATKVYADVYHDDADEHAHKDAEAYRELQGSVFTLDNQIPLKINPQNTYIVLYPQTTNLVMTTEMQLQYLAYTYNKQAFPRSDIPTDKIQQVHQLRQLIEQYNHRTPITPLFVVPGERLRFITEDTPTLDAVGNEYFLASVNTGFSTAYLAHHDANILTNIGAFKAADTLARVFLASVEEHGMTSHTTFTGYVPTRPLFRQRLTDGWMRWHLLLVVYNNV